MPLVRISGTRTLTGDGGPFLREFGIERNKLFLSFGHIIFVENGLFRAFWHTDGAIDAFIRINDKEIGTDTEAVDRAYSHAGRIRAIDTGVTYYMSHSFLPTEIFLI